MAEFCIPKDIADKISQKIDEETMGKIFDMKPEERIKFFSDAGDNAGDISKSFDDILAEAKRDSLERAMKTIGITDKNELKAIRSEIRKLNNEQLLDPGNDAGIIKRMISSVSDGVVTEEEVAKLTELGANIEKHKSIVDTTPLFKGGRMNVGYAESMLEMAKQQKKMDDFILSKTPTSKAETFWAHAKASMLFKPASWMVNIVSNTLNTGIEGIARRLGTGKFLGGYNSTMVSDWKKLMAKIYKETGYDYSRALSLDDMVTGGGKALGETTGVSKDTWFTKMIYKTALGGPDAFSARMNFGDAANIYSSKIADGLGLGTGTKARAAEILEDAMSVIPRTKEGKMVRELAVADALRATFTNDGAWSKFALGIKNGINAIPGFKTAKVGDLLEPFVKTPSNVIEQGLDMAGLGSVKGVLKFLKYRNIKNIDPEKAKILLTNGLKDISRSGMGIVGSFMIANKIGEDNFMGAYDPARSKWEQLRDSNYNAVKIGDKWISLDYLGPLGTPLIAMLYAKKYGKESSADFIGSYIKGAANQAKNLPFLSSVSELFTKFDEASAVDKKKFYPFITKWFTEQIAARIPGIMTDIGKLSDNQVRDISTGKFGKWGVNLDPIAAKLPWVLSSLPEKRNILGEEMNTEKSKVDNVAFGFWSTLLAGARIKQEQKSPEGKEIYRLYDSGNPPTITNWRYIQSEKLQRLKDKVGDDRYNEIFKNEYGPKFKSGISSLMSTSKYQKSSDAEKKKMIDKKEDEIMNSIYSKNGIK